MPSFLQDLVGLLADAPTARVALYALYFVEQALSLPRTPGESGGLDGVIMDKVCQQGLSFQCSCVLGFGLTVFDVCCASEDWVRMGSATAELNLLD